MIVAVAFCPHPPGLVQVPDGAGPELDELRADQAGDSFEAGLRYTAAGLGAPCGGVPAWTAHA